MTKGRSRYKSVGYSGFWSILFIWLNETNQMNKIDRINQMNQR